jgi:hypothetical protein
MGGIVPLISGGFCDHGYNPHDNKKPEKQDQCRHGQIGNIGSPKLGGFLFQFGTVYDHGLRVHGVPLVVVDIGEDFGHQGVIAVEDFEIIVDKLAERVSHESPLIPAIRIDWGIDVYVALGALRHGEGFHGLPEVFQSIAGEVERGFGFGGGFDVVYGGLFHTFKIVITYLYVKAWQMET